MPFYETNYITKRTYHALLTHPAGVKHDEKEYRNLLFVQIPYVAAADVVAAYFRRRFAGKDVKATGPTKGVPLQPNPLDMSLLQHVAAVHRPDFDVQAPVAIDLDQPLDYQPYRVLYRFRDALGIAFQPRLRVVAVVVHPYTYVAAHLRTQGLDASKEPWDTRLASLLPQSTYVSDVTDTHVVPWIRLVKSESLQADMAQLGYDDVPPPRFPVKSMATLPKEAKAYVDRRYARDFAWFGYTRG
jgi:hypothetical protein